MLQIHQNVYTTPSHTRRDRPSRQDQRYGINAEATRKWRSKALMVASATTPAVLEGDHRTARLVLPCGVQPASRAVADPDGAAELVSIPASPSPRAIAA